MSFGRGFPCCMFCLLLLHHYIYVIHSDSHINENFEGVDVANWNEYMTSEDGSRSDTHTDTRISVAPESQSRNSTLRQDDTIQRINELGNRLKQKVEMFQKQKLDVVFLVDASSSVGDENFLSELKFVKKLLADFAISINETRVALITFSDQDKVIRHVDHISIPSSENHKCSMLHQDLPNINYSGGLTYTLGAMVEAQSVLEWARAEAQKVVFLVTDGFSNGGPPEQVAQILKDNGTFIFTFGIQSGNIPELEHMASPPAEEFSYFVDSFDQFEAVVRRALHQDLSIGSYQFLNDTSSCDLLCSNLDKGDGGCCDPQAQCSCGTGSGHYRCLCKPGYYGSGLKGSCHACPNGTYHDGLTPGDKSVCSRCPDPNHITMMGSASSKASCICKRGFVARGNSCEVITCPVLDPPQHGYFVKRGMCPTVFNAACGMRCKVGYSLHGSSIRLCLENGTWSGKAPKCVVKMCSNPEMPLNGDMKCSLEPSVSNDLLYPNIHDTKAIVRQYAVDTECHFSCKPGHILTGSRHRMCLPLARWDGLRTVCKPVMCRPLTKLYHGSITPEICSGPSKVPFGQNCDITCDKGYRLVGPTSRKCGGKGGQWTMKSSPSKCVDEQPPNIICPGNIEVPTDPAEPFSTVIIPQPEVTDNSGKKPIVWSRPTVTEPMKIFIGVLHITFIAMDPSRNQAMCNLTVTVLDKESPVIESCISPKSLHLLETGGNQTVSWMDPEFNDNSRKKLNVTSSHSSGEFPVGKTEVFVTAWDETGNNSTCVLEVIVEESPCSQQPPKLPHASIICEPEEGHAIHCSMSCNEGYAFDTSNFEDSLQESVYKNGSFSYSCPGTTAQKNNDSQSHIILPRCGETILPNSISQEGQITFIARRGVCEDNELIAKVKSTVDFEVSKKSQEFCNQSLGVCHVFDTNATCEDIASLEEEETNIITVRKRSLLPLSTVFRKEVRAVWASPSNPQKHHFLKRRETIASVPRSSNVHVNFRVMFRNALEAHQMRGSENDFNDFKDLLGKTTFNLPPDIDRHSFLWSASGPVLNCSDGSVAHNSGICVKCPSGTFFTHLSRKCLPCLLGEYQTLDGQTKCLTCPKGMSTRYGGSQTEHDCLYLCHPGSFGRLYLTSPSGGGNSVSPCSLCPPGTYQPNYGASSCLPCPSGMHSYRRGAKNINECLKTGRINPWSHPKNCPSNLCQNGGSCKFLSGFVSCDCQIGFYGSYCETELDSCNSSPCLNGGQCLRSNHSAYTCKCPSGFHGHNCENETDQCSPNPCLNNGTCEDSSYGFFCDCSDGFQGSICEENIDDCYNNPCGDHGVCVDGVSTYNCTCINGYSGHYCQNDPIDPCFGDNPCLNGGICVSEKTNMYKCACSMGWEGQHCENQDVCFSSPCLNNGTCASLEDGRVHCHCLSSFGGDFCQIRLTSDFVLHMHSASVTDYAVIDFPSKNLEEISACLWLQSKDGLNYGTAFSYANMHHFNAFTLTDYNGFVLYVNGDRVVTDVSANDGLWHHVCVLWQSYLGMWSIYLDGTLRDSGSRLSTNRYVSGKGKFVLGQEQDSVGGSFSEAESLIGRIYMLDVWEYGLRSSEINILAKECNQSIEGSLVKWSDFLPRIHGNIKVENSTFCLDCPPPDSLWHGAVSVIKDDSGSVAHYLCDNGFILRRTKFTMIKRRCLKQGSWEGTAPQCVRQSCGFPGYLPGGTFFGRSFLYSDTVKYTCHSGSEIFGNETRVCQADGKWSGELPICKGRECPILAAPKYGKILKDVTSGGAQMASFSCDDGFHIDGAPVLNCMHDGTWDESVPDCIRNTCPKPPQFQHAVCKTSVDSFVFMDMVHYECNPGYKMLLSSSSIIYCNKDGKWFPYKLNSTQESVMNHPSCQEDLCLEPDELNYGSWTLKTGTVSNTSLYSSGTVLAAKCDTYYNLFGPRTKYCKDFTWWPQDVTQCVKITCDTDELPFDIPHSSIHLSGEEVGDIAKISCRDGYLLHTAKPGTPSQVGDFSGTVVPKTSMSWICDADGSWIMNDTYNPGFSGESELVACLPQKKMNTKTQCLPPQAPTNGYILTNSTKVNYTVGSMIELRCRFGFWLDGPTSVVCGQNGSWTISSVCRRVKCHSLPQFPNMVIARATAIGRDMEYGDMVIFSCALGFQPRGELHVVCQSNGRWSALIGICIPMRHIT